MQLGFAYLEGGCVRYKNMQSIMIKVFSNAAISIIMSWLVGYAFMFGESDRFDFIGTNLFAANGFEEHPQHYAHFGTGLPGNFSVLGCRGCRSEQYRFGWCR
jgi:Amt family ammonium transporter